MCYVMGIDVGCMWLQEMTDAFGNVIKIKAPKKKLSNKEKKALAKVRKARRDRGEEVTDSEEDE